MGTKLTTPLKREIDIDGATYTVVLSANGLKLTRKRFREGQTVTWRRLLELGVTEGSES